MAAAKTLLRSFAGGEITPEMYGRLDNVKFQTGVALARNAIVLPHGPLCKRAGLAYVNQARDSSNRVRLLPFVFSESQSMVLELGHQYIRFHTLGSTLLEANKAITSITQAAPGVLTVAGHGYSTGDDVYLNNIGGMPALSGRYLKVNALTADTFSLSADGVPISTAGMPAYAGGGVVARVYTIASPYQSADLFDLVITQSADVLTIVSRGYQARELRRLGATNWQLVVPTLGSAIASPPSVTATTTSGNPDVTPYPKDYYYKVTAVSQDGSEESLPTASNVANNDLTVQGARNTITWTAPAGVTSPSYRVYKAPNTPNRLFGYIGETLDTTFVDDNITPDYSRSAPADIIRLDTATNYPGAVTYYEQRRLFAGTARRPQTIYGTRTATESNLSTSSPGQDGDAIELTIKAQQQNTIQHLLPLGDLLALTSGGVWRIYSNNNEAILPSTVAAKPQSYVGASRVRPALTGENALFVEYSGKRLRDVSYSWESQGYRIDDRSVMAPHLFDGYTITDMAFARIPDAVLWCVRSDGVLLSLTYLPEHQVFGWTRHVTDGFVESVTVVPENSNDTVYFVVRRTLRGQTVRVVERMASRLFVTQGDAFFVDCGGTYRGTPSAVIGGLWHLEGQTVVALADGAVVRGLVVSAGQVTLPDAASVVHVGLPYTYDVQTLPLALDGAPAGGQGTRKNVTEAYLRVNRTGVLLAGRDADHLRPLPARTNEPYNSPPRLASEELAINVDADWGGDGQFWVRSEDPVPITLSALVLQVSLGG